MSPTSSRNSVPPSASSKRPSLRLMAPVKAPFSWPNSSVSSSVSASAPQLTLTNGPGRRAASAGGSRARPAPCRCPTRRRCAPTCRSARRARRSAKTLRIGSRAADHLAEARRLLAAQVRVLRLEPRPWRGAPARSSSARSTLSRTTSGANGLMRKSKAPSFIASTAVSTVPKAVMIIAGQSGSSSRTAAQHLDAVEPLHLEVGDDEVGAASA